jgi:2-keto-4-pentenoate hydratase/2-oxohepta-3-ene-1,7-dioic acid hydratase in catechol pathway
MRLGDPGQERPAVRADDGTVHDLRPITTDIDGGFLEDGGIARARVGLDAGRLPRLDPAGLRVGAPVTRPGKVICIGLNYRDHAAETGAKIPDEPIVFFKGGDTVIGPNDQVLIPRGSSKTDWEVELAIVIGARTRDLDSPAQSPAAIAGYAISNDVSERAFQLERGGQWVKGKSCETFNPLGPWLVPADEVATPQSLNLSLSVNGQQRQNSNTSNMIFAIDHIIWYVSQFMVLEPGDVINTGTPHGVAMGLDDKPYLRAGDVMELQIEGLGSQRQELAQA